LIQRLGFVTAWSAVMLAVAALAPVACASQLRLLASNTTAFSSDGSRFAAWQISPAEPIVVLDTLTGHEARTVPPSGCRLRNEDEIGWPERSAAAGRFLLNCEPERQALLDVWTGKTIRLPRPRGTVWFVVGTRYIQGQWEVCSRKANCQALYEIATGALHFWPEHRPTNLDAGGASVTAFCPAVRSLVRSFGSVREFPNASEQNLFVHRSGTHGNVQIDHCHGRPTTIEARGRSGPGEGAPWNFDLRGGLLSWDTGSDPTEFSPSQFPGRLYTYGLATHRRDSWPLPRRTVPGGEAVTGTYGYSTHTANTAFWIADTRLGGEPTLDVTRSAVYAARLP
jgi:hypothetical protein